ncbi:MAG: dihydroorotate dehydrogenase [Bacteroidales bacterium]|nr:dihydroorotate dehydrogenase [Bacteroidales bacterium]
MADLSVQIKNLVFRNPVTLASGTCGFGEEMTPFINPDLLGGLFVKGLTIRNREGNPYPRMAETASGMLNAIGLQNKGVDYFIQDILPRIRHYQTHIIPNINGSTVKEYIQVAEKLADLDRIPAIELNISCPNVKAGGMEFGITCPSAFAVTEAIRKVYPKVLIVKLSPNVTHITEIAKAVEDAGADAVSLINTLLGMAINADTRKPVLSTVTGGLSGPAIKPVALRMVWQVYRSVGIPVIGIGGIMNALDAIEFMLAGASVVQVGTASFIDPTVSLKVIQGIEDYLNIHHISRLRDLTGGLITD